MTRLGSAALAYAQHENVHPAKNWTGLCLQFTRMCFGIAAAARTAYDRDNGRVARSAYGAWLMAERKHPGDRNPPPAVPVFFRGRAGGPGHIAVSAGNGLVWSTDVQRPGKVDLVRIAAIERAWGQTYLGWSADLNGASVFDGTYDGGPRGPWPFNANDKLGPHGRGRDSWHDGSRPGERAALVQWQTEVGAPVTGRWDDATRVHTLRWQLAVDMPETGYPGAREWATGTRR